MTVTAEKDLACACSVVHEENVRAAQEASPSADTLAVLGDLFKVFSDPSRLKILSALAATELCVCDLQAVLGASQSAVSHQLAVLRAARLVRSRREGKTIYYALDDSHVRDILLVGLDHVGERGQA
jgi:DNA-binding transcriptional ArsR family regulator